MPGQRIPKVAAALLTAAAMTTAAPVDSDGVTMDRFVEVLALAEDLREKGEGETTNGGCAEH